MNDPARSGTTFAAGEAVGPYRIVGLLGAGGMGEVFRARDTQLNRDVALKMLPAAAAMDPERLARFGREAQALAALNHPHIAAIYGLEGSGGRQALVLELVDGVTLASRIGDGPLPVVEALTLARQIADALEAAHAKGIVHRDLKPANIKVTPAGVVKVLDFGLAKTVGDLEDTVLSPSPVGPGHTMAGTVLGTASYMSPEQARGQAVDTRTDIWAFGCVLYEMLAGRRAFPGDSASDAIARILDGEPDWRALPKSTPPAIRRLLRDCLQKNPRERPQSIAVARLVIDRHLTRRTPAWVTAAVVVVLATLASIGIYRALGDGAPPADRPAWVQLTNLDSVAQPALSPDGRLLAFLRGSNTFVSPGQIYVKLLPHGEAVALTNDALPKMGPVFSPDSSRIAYTVNEAGSWDTWDVPTLRGEPRLWLRNASGLTWMAEDDLLFSEVKTGIHMAIVRSRADRRETRDVYVPPHLNGMAHRSHASPDGRYVLVVEMDEKGLWLPCRLVSIDGGASHTVGPTGPCTAAAWSPDGRWMYFTANAGDGFHVWRQRPGRGAPEQLTSGPTEEEGLAVAPDGASLITSVGLTLRSVWIHDAAGDRQVSLEGYAFWPLLSADGRAVVFRVTRGVGTGQTPSELWTVEPDSGHKARLFPGQLVTGHDLSHDGRVVASIVEGEGRTGIWLAWLDGREPPQRIPNADGDNPRFAPGDAILYRAVENGSSRLYRIRADGTGRQRVAEPGNWVSGTVSPDGEWLSGVDAAGALTVLYSTRGRASRPLFPSASTSRLRWSPDGTRAYLSIQYGQASAFAEGRTYVLPLAKGSVLPPALPPGGFRSESELAALAGVEVLPYGDVSLGPSPNVYAYSRVTTTRNLYRIPIE